ncbi:sensor histidine kinase [Sphingomonas ginkgonis]|uniref:histidine kinase n=1 Tax=Sphingomonas ginkgonis TaxID=2315330 RepID=A0A3R9YNA0_9SPHN|nr:ATP-binding protein [Sphingomonas ginkgonis]RST31388.1 sensor histidine kinase [Sphingomonas ginkgonis]
MDGAPTTSPVPAAALPPTPDTAAENLRQLVQLRWLAVAGQIATILVAHFLLGVPLPLGAMLGIAALLAAVNLGTLVSLPRHRITNVEITFALLFDMGALALQLYLSGGTTNPFSLLFLLQVVLGAMLLERWSVWLLVVLATFFYAALGLVHWPLRLPSSLVADAGLLYGLAGWISFALAGLLLTLFMGRISGNLRARDAYLGELRERAAEQENIVRMGLFASGAAHELGTPLATLSVLVGDWRRLPRIREDPQLLAEVEEMRGEVERCKAIVTDILHSAGEPRGAPLAREYAGAFVQAIATEWRVTYPATALLVDDADVGSATLAVEPALRQAVWNLLENAAEVSPGQVGLRAVRRGERLVIAVEDSGPGFASGQLEQIGRPVPSSKGEGRGVGLFLAANVARQLGGRLEARNLRGRGAEVRIELPAGSDDAREVQA